MNPKRLVHQFGPINAEQTSRLIEQVLKIFADAKDEEIYLLVGSGGGNVQMAYAFYDIVEAMSIPLTTIGVGYVDSAALYIFLAGRKRLIAKHATFLIHQTRRTFDANTSVSLEDIGAGHTEVSTILEHQCQIVESRTNGRITADQFETMKRRVTSLTAEEAIKHGIAHEIWQPNAPA